MRPKYKAKYHNALQWAITASLITIAMVWATFSFYQTANRLKDRVKALEETQNVMIWTMDKSCFDQMQNSNDGTIKN